MTSEAPTFAVDCGGHRHTLRLDGSTLIAEDHDEDAEAAAATLGGKPPPCVALVTAWSVQPTSDILGDAAVSALARAAIDGAPPLRDFLVRAATAPRLAQLVAAARSGAFVGGYAEVDPRVFEAAMGVLLAGPPDLLEAYLRRLRPHG